MSYTHYEDLPSGLTVYAKENPLDTGTWSNGVIAGSENGTTGNYSFASVDAAKRYTLYKQAGGSPASSDDDIGYIENHVPAEIATKVAEKTNTGLRR